MTDLIDLNPTHFETVRRILAEHLPECEVWAFGSRATWTAKDSSDLDLAVVGAAPLGRKTLGQLREAFEESNLPVRVDVVDWHAIPESFHREIERDYVVVQERGSTLSRSVLLPHPNAQTKAVDGWRTERIGNLVELTLSSVDKKSKPDELPVVLCNYTDVYKNSFIHGNLAFMPATATAREVANCSLLAGDVLITKDSETHDDIGVPALVREEIPNLVCGYHLAILRPVREDLDGGYLFYAVSTQASQQQFHSLANGVTRFGLRKDDIGKVEIPLPPLLEQRAIAHVLGTLDDKIELNHRMCETLEAMARALFQSWFVDFEPVRAKMEGRWRPGESLPGLPAEHYHLFPDTLVPSSLGYIPEGWEVRTLGEVVEVNPHEPLQKGEPAPYLDMAALPTLGPNPEDAVPREFTSGMRFRNGDTLLARITPCLENGKTAFVQGLPKDTIGWGSTEFIVMRAKPPIPSAYTYLLARDDTFREHAIQSMTGTSGRQRVQIDALLPYLLPYSPAEVWSAFEVLIERLFSRIDFGKQESSALSAKRDALLPRLVSGEVRAG